MLCGTLHIINKVELNSINFIPSGYVNNNVASTHSVTNHPKSNLAKQMYNQLQQQLNQQQNQQSQQSLPIIKSLINIDDVDDSNQNTITNEATLSSSPSISFSSPNIDISTTSPNSTQQHQTSSQHQPKEQPQPKQAKKTRTKRSQQQSQPTQKQHQTRGKNKRAKITDLATIELTLKKIKYDFLFYKKKIPQVTKSLIIKHSLVI